MAAGPAPPAQYGVPEQPVVADPFPGLRPPGVPAMPWFDAGQMPVATTPPRAASLPPQRRITAPGMALPHRKRAMDQPVSAGSVPPSTPARAEAAKEVYIGTQSPLGTPIKEADEKGKQEVTKGKQEETVEGNLMAKLAEAVSGINQSIVLLTKRLDRVDADPPTSSTAPQKAPQISQNLLEPLKEIHLRTSTSPASSTATNGRCGARTS